MFLFCFTLGGFDIKKYINENDIKLKCEDLKLEFIGLSKEYKKGTMINFICNKHKDIGVQKSAYSHFKTAKKGCRYCAGKGRTTDSFKNEIEDINSNITILSEYTGTEERVDCLCNVCDNYWSTIPRSLLYGQGCPLCGIEKSAKKRRKTHEQYIFDLNQINPNIKILNKYISSRSIMKCECLIDGEIWSSYASNLLNKSAGCPNCNKRKQHDNQKLSNNEFLNRLLSLNVTYTPLDEYYNYFKKLKCICNIHNEIFYQTPHGMFKGQNGCPKCHTYKGEEILVNILEEMELSVTLQKTFPDCKHVNSLKFDAYDEINKIAYEYNGEQHYYPIDFSGRGYEFAQEQFELSRIRDEIKINYCKNNNIPLIIIPYWERDNMEMYIKNALNELYLTHYPMSNNIIESVTTVIPIMAI